MSQSRPLSRKYCAHRAEVCRKAYLRLVTTVHIAGKCIACCTIVFGARRISMQLCVVLECAKNYIASKYTISFINTTIFKSYLDLDLSESDWSRFVIRFWLSDWNEKRFEPAFVRFMDRNVSRSNHSAKTGLRTCTSLTQTGAGLSMIWK